MAFSVTFSDQQYIDAWITHFRDAPDTDKYLDIKLVWDVTHLMQVRITRSPDLVCLDQGRQIGVLAAEYGLIDCKPVLTLMSANLDLAKIAHTTAAFIPFRQLAGALLWIGRHTCQEIMQPVVYFAQFSRDMAGITFGCPSNIEIFVYCEGQGGHDSPLPAAQARLTMYSDSDWAMDSSERKLYSGNVVYMNGDLVGW